MNIMTIFGTRPEIIRLSQVIAKLDKWAGRHVTVYTGQNFDRTLSDVFFEQLNIRQPNYRIHLESHAFGAQVGQMFTEVEEIIRKEKPDKLLVLGDTNSALCAILGERNGIPVYHMEAGNRCFDTDVPEELNRRIIDAVSSFNLPYTPGSRDNLLHEGIHPTRIWVSGNPIYEVLQSYRTNIAASPALEQFGLAEQKYFVATVHRAENVDVNERLNSIFQGLTHIAEEWDYPVLVSVHPRTRARLEQFGICHDHPRLVLHEPLGLFDFVRLQQGARCVITDSGTVQEESCILGVPSVTVRKSTERPETIVCGSNLLAGVESERIRDGVRLMAQSARTWTCPEGYCQPDVSTKITQFLIGGLCDV
ncbi:UDP-N-acetylglucosamine 2-epimerase (non-hydrolyzing) [Alicyclobacillus acidoterrestris]|uniref:UDP-N-acetylglucosamine 2-epimerase (Non-hydrolyzing) n=2 Tax=Alicyclobacillus acidoterrestris TaxID=1450 RepID=T0CTI4_ALIAG|nr:hypothetical protein N007_14320 [Alicyclobacillus acidoterrestris ATCC 49025]UNO50105.1 UDP-N-acetylglucosamine 2-epimerase (non-hydrolyzing) [Alicyclobacillus acidoterrestris]